MFYYLIVSLFVYKINGQQIAYSNCTFNGYTRWLTFDNRTCYFVSNYSQRVSWHDANEACQQMGAQLLSIHDQPTNHKFAVATRKLSTYSYNEIYWIGLNALSQRGVYKWSDGSTYQYSNWPYNAPQGVPKLTNSDYFTQGRCVYFYSLYIWQKGSYQNYGYWYYHECNDLHSYICAKNFGTTVTPQTTTPLPTGNCESGWYQFDDKKCIKMLDTQTTYTAAQRRCVQNFRGDLLGIHSLKEQHYITALIAGKPAPYIGLTKVESTYRWSWSDQSNLSFTNWGNQFAHTYNYAAKCGIISSNDAQSGMWMPVECDSAHPAICEKPKGPSVSSPPPNAFSNCTIIPGLDSFIQYRNSCYFISDSPQTWDDAVAQCQLMNDAHLVSILNGFEYSFLMYIVLQYSQLSSHWIGFFSPEILTDALTTIQAFEWIDTWPNYYTRWDENEPVFNTNGTKTCVYQTKANGTWKTDNCDQMRGFICKKTIDRAVEFNFTGGVCPKRNTSDKRQFWVDLDKRSKYCYWFSMDLEDKLGAVTWSDASFHCRQRNGTLATIHSEHDMSILKNKISSAKYNTWIGLYQLPEGSYAWDDGSPLDFTNWDMNYDDEDQSRAETDTCVEIQSHDLRWHKTKCTGYSGYRFYVCQTPKILGSNPTASSFVSNDQLSRFELSSGARAAIIVSSLTVIGIAIIGIAYLIKKYNINAPTIASFDNTMFTIRRGTGLMTGEPKVTFNKINDNMSIQKS